MRGGVKDRAEAAGVASRRAGPRPGQVPGARGGHLSASPSPNHMKKSQQKIPRGENQ